MQIDLFVAREEELLREYHDAQDDLYYYEDQEWTTLVDATWQYMKELNDELTILFALNNPNVQEA